MRTIEVYADIACPFAHVGLRHVVEARRERDLAEPVLRLRAWPLEVVNDRPFEGRHLGPEIAALRAGVAPDLFAAFDEHSFPASTIDALAAEAAASRAGADVGERFSLAVRAALWERGLDVADGAVLAALLDEHGVPPVTDDDRAAVDEDLRAGRARGVQGSPHFFVDGADFFCPSLDIRHEGRDWDVSFDEDGFRRFVDAAFPTPPG